MTVEAAEEVERAAERSLETSVVPMTEGSFEVVVVVPLICGGGGRGGGDLAADGPICGGGGLGGGADLDEVQEAEIARLGACRGVPSDALREPEKEVCS